MSEVYEIKLPQFEGPFDLLLFFIERDELDVYDIPIAKITNDFLEYIHHLEKLDIEVASEFILVAATLMRIKAKLLLPRKEQDPETGEDIDPREELVTRLLEYKKFKEASEALRFMEDDRQSLNKRGNILSENKLIADSFETEFEMQSLTMLRLLKAFQNVIIRIERERNKPVHTVVQPPYTIEGERSIILDLLHYQEETAFERVFEMCLNRTHAIFTFLAVLEMVQERFIKITIGEGYNNFWLRKLTEDEREALENPPALEE